MDTIHIRHRTVYRYTVPVVFGEHRLMVRPRDSHDLRNVSTRLIITPSANIRWLHDVFGNSIAIVTFETPAAELTFESDIVVEHYGLDDIAFPIEENARTLPFSYAAEELPDLGRTIERHYPDPGHKLDTWVRQFLAQNGPSWTQSVLNAITHAIHNDFRYIERSEEGTQPPVVTLERGAGTCRDFALLMMEGLRVLGIAARFVTGYLYDPSSEQSGIPFHGAGSTHAWVQAYLPGAGWVEFDPTNGLVSGKNLIRVGVARDPSQAIPIQGSFTGPPGAFTDMTIEVSVLSNVPQGAFGIDVGTAL
ncbi:transglutaminase family protein [Varunaivibrio sulfuroxidans]|uniref:Transglutaminase-like putative cysteine protease n=1 Tax=Varunaivibrio sulfuroxidans TaxID=1773489 RepID=A0A4R3JG60_9PROT|nr:transglutaminase family protein [Varunaivibrio sulfuroxidans]TCS65138.1 transglutaminase-like putative cysteine protease [Varunaivibrio sulfuroxidans]WES29577.1 transglutaminase family protein [Varunaivibrio sulfuroxidans]